VLKAYFSTNEIITSLMMNYLALNLVNYLILNSESYWRDLSPLKASFPQGRRIPFGADWMPIELGSVSVPLGFAVGIGVAVVIWILYRRTRFGFEVSVIGDSRPAARYAGMRDRRKVVAVMALSGAMAGLGGASNIGDFNHVLDPKNLARAGYGYTGIVVAALARLNPLAVVVVSIVLGGIANAGRALQGPDFPAGLVGTIQGLILFFALGGEVLARYRIRRRTPATRAAAAS
jgi:simple sugar transport system permease protein